MVKGNEVGQAGLCNDFSVKADKHNVLLLDVSDLRKKNTTFEKVIQRTKDFDERKMRNDN